MSKFDDLTNAVLDLKDQKKTLYRERESTCDKQRHEEITIELQALTNKLYDAVGDLCEFIEKETGVYAHDFPDLLKCDGYVMSKNPLVPLPKRVKFD